MSNIALITGGAAGIGKALVHQCLKRKMQVIVLDKSQQALTDLKNEVGIQLIPFCVDLMDEAAVATVIETISKEFGCPNYLFNNAGIGGDFKPVWQQDLKKWKQVFDVNFFSTIQIIQHFIPEMLQNKQANHIVNIASMASYYTAPLIAPYVTSKQAILAYSECLYHDLQLTEANINISVVCPGGVKSNILEKVDLEKLTKDFNSNQQHFLVKFGKLIKKGISTDTVAELIFLGIENKQFYIFTHPEMLDLIRNRMQTTLNQKHPQAWLYSK